MQIPEMNPSSNNPARVVIVGAGSRGNAYARAIVDSPRGEVMAIAEPVDSKRDEFGRKYIWHDDHAVDGQSFRDWKDYIHWELTRRAKAARGEAVPAGADGVFVCTLDPSHADIVTALAPLRLHVLCEKPLATTLEDCLNIYRALDNDDDGPAAIFGIAHVLRYR